MWIKLTNLCIFSCENLKFSSSDLYSLNTQNKVDDSSCFCLLVVHIIHSSLKSHFFCFHTKLQSYRLLLLISIFFPYLWQANTHSIFNPFTRTRHLSASTRFSVSPARFFFSFKSLDPHGGTIVPHYKKEFDNPKNILVVTVTGFWS